MIALTPMPLDLERAAAEFYEPLFRFAASLTHNSADAADLTQQTFYIAQTRGHQLRDPSRLKTWLFTTLMREFLQRRRHETRFPKFEIGGVAHELPQRHDDHSAHLDGQAAIAALATLPENFRVPMVLFYLESKSYQEIARAIRRPIGTVMSRLARGRQQLRASLEGGLRARRPVSQTTVKYPTPELAIAA